MHALKSYTDVRDCVTCMIIVNKTNQDEKLLKSNKRYIKYYNLKCIYILYK